MAQARILLVGPFPPPEHGTSVPFALFCRFMKSHMRDPDQLVVVNTQTGDKAVTGYLSLGVLGDVLAVVWRIMIEGGRAGNICIFGSQRLATFVVCAFGPWWRLAGKRVSVRIFGGAYDVYYYSRPAPARWILRKLMGACSAIVVETRLVRDALAEVWPATLSAIPNYREYLSIGRRRTVGRVEETIFLYFGVIRSGKGIGELITAFDRLRASIGADRAKSVQLWLYGPIYDARIGAYDLTAVDELQRRNVQLFGNVSTDRIQAVLSLSDVFVFPSYWATEGHSGSLLEAMGAGMPIIATRWRATPELIEDRVSGLLCEPRNSADLERCMRELLDQPALRERLGKSAAAAAERYRADIVCGRLAAAMDVTDVLSSPGGSV